MNIDEENLVWIDMRNPPPGRIDPARMGKPRSPSDTEPRPVITKEDVEATLRLARKEHGPAGEEWAKRLLKPWT
jgi:hypothetical protein